MSSVVQQHQLRKSLIRTKIPTLEPYLAKLGQEKKTIFYLNQHLFTEYFPQLGVRTAHKVGVYVAQGKVLA